MVYRMSIQAIIALQLRKNQELLENNKLEVGDEEHQGSKYRGNIIQGTANLVTRAQIFRQDVFCLASQVDTLPIETWAGDFGV